MQLTVYKCDQCKKEIGKVPHFSLNFAGMGGTTGVAVPPKDTIGRWVLSRFPRSWIHLHFGCVTAYFKKLEKEANI